MGPATLPPRLWNDCVDAIPIYRAMKEKKKSEEFCKEFAKELLKKYPGADVNIPGDTPFHQVHAKHQSSRGLTNLTRHRGFATGLVTKDVSIGTRKRNP